MFHVQPPWAIGNNACLCMRYGCFSTASKPNSMTIKKKVKSVWEMCVSCKKSLQLTTRAASADALSASPSSNSNRSQIVHTILCTQNININSSWEVFMEPATKRESDGAVRIGTCQVYIKGLSPQTDSPKSKWAWFFNLVKNDTCILRQPGRINHSTKEFWERSREKEIKNGTRVV